VVGLEICARAKIAYEMKNGIARSFLGRYHQALLDNRTIVFTIEL
jgi:hypothetical protein